MAKSRSLNKVMLIGNLTRSPIIKENSGNILICTFGIATNSSWKDRNGEVQERTEFHNLIAFNKLAEICATVLDTGMLVYVEGELRTRVVEDQEGKKVFKSEIKLNDMSLLDSKGKKGVGIENAKNTHENSKEQEIESIPVEGEDFKSEDLF